MEEHQKTQERQINGADYSSTPLDPELGLSVSSRILKLVGAAAVPLLRSASAGDDAVADDASGAALQAIATNLEDRAVVKLVRDLLSQTVRRKDGVKFTLSSQADFNNAYRANYMELLQAAAFAIEVNRFLGSGEEDITALVGAIGSLFQGLISPESQSEQAQD